MENFYLAHAVYQSVNKKVRLHKSSRLESARKKSPVAGSLCLGFQRTDGQLESEWERVASAPTFRLPIPGTGLKSEDPLETLIDGTKHKSMHLEVRSD